jgi:hypothetical protein
MQLNENLMTPIVDIYDVIVAGSGPAGSAAAITAARAGARTLLLECNGCLGGVWTAGQLTWLFEMDKMGFTEELNSELIRRNARRGSKTRRYVYEIEEMKLLLEEMCLAAGVDFLFNTRVTKAYINEKNNLDTVITESKSGRQAWKAKIFIDATGDGDLSAQAGCGYDYGMDDTGITQPMTYMALITVYNAESLKEFISFYEEADISSPGELTDESKQDWVKRHFWQNFKLELKRAGIEPSYGMATLFRVRENLLALMVNHEYEVSSIDTGELTAATVRARAEINRVVKALRSLGGAWSGIVLAATAEHIGVREGRRIHGLYRVTKEDLIAGSQHQDAVVRVNVGVDVHSLNQKRNQIENGLSNMNIKSKPYDVPFRALIAKDVNGLLLAGRCISGDFIAHASYRVTGIAATLGQAAGAAAAISAQSERLPQEIEWEEIKQKIEQVYAKDA